MGTLLHGRGITPGVAEGIALVSHEPIGFNFGVDAHTGILQEKGHELEGQCLKDTILVFPHGKGSTGGSFVIYSICKEGNGPKAIVNGSCESIIALGGIMAGIPIVDHLESDPLMAVSTGDRVRVNGHEGTLEILQKNEASHATDR